MSKFNTKQLKTRAFQQVSDEKEQVRKLVFIYFGVSIAISLLVNGLNVLLDAGIDTTGGLSGLGTRSVLETAQTILQYAASIFSPFWQMGFIGIAIRIALSANIQPRQLFSGFQRLPRVLGYFALQMALFFACGIACSYLATFIFSMSPFADSLVDVLEPLMSGGMPDLESLPVEQLLKAYIPLLVIMMVIFLPVYIFLRYTFRLAGFYIMDEPGLGAFAAMRSSASAMRGYRLAMFRLDLSYWWYYLAECCLVIVCYLDMILPLLGISLPVNSTVAFFGALVLYGILELVFQLWLNARVEVTYALAYREIRGDAG